SVDKAAAAKRRCHCGRHVGRGFRAADVKPVAKAINQAVVAKEKVAAEHAVAAHKNEVHTEIRHARGLIQKLRASKRELVHQQQGWIGQFTQESVLQRDAKLAQRLQSARRAFVQHSSSTARINQEQALLSGQDRKTTRLNSSHEWISYAVFCLKK